MKSTKSDKRPLFDKYNLGVYNGVKITLNIPNKNYKKADKDNKYFLESYYNKKQKQHKETVRDMFADYTASIANRKLSVAQKLTDLQELYRDYINEIVTRLNVTVLEQEITLYTNVLAAVNQYFSYQQKQFEMGELVDQSDYKDRNKKLNDYFNLPKNQLLRLKDLNITVWEEFRYFLLGNYDIKAHTTVNQYITYCKSFYNWLAKKEVLIFNHPNSLKPLKRNTDKKHKDLGVSRVNELLEVLSKDKRYLRLYILCLFLAENAKRNVQVYTLQHKNIDLKNKLVYLQPKAKHKSLEITEISEELVTAIQQVYDNTTSANQLIDGNCYLLGGYNKFKKIGSSPIMQGNMNGDQIEKFRVDYPEFADILVYELKHTTLTAVSRVNPKMAQKMANHSTIRTTEIYDLSKQVSPSISRDKLVSGIIE